mgnify:CR=1 FL=1
MNQEYKLSTFVDQEEEPPALPSGIAGSGRLDRLVETARDYARLGANAATLLSEIETNAKPKDKPGQGPKSYGPKI